MPEAYLLSESDRKAIQSLLDENKTKRFNTANRPRTDNLDTEGIAPEVYVALTPADGIPALTVDVNEGTSIGTGTSDLIDHPGSIQCNIYRVINHGGEPTLEPITGLSKLVYNLTSSAIGGDQWLLVLRDKFGTWFASSGGSSGPNNTCIVKTPFMRNLSGIRVGGIPASRRDVIIDDVYLETGTGTGTSLYPLGYVATGTGTGTESLLPSEQLGYAECQVYKIVINNPTDLINEVVPIPQPELVATGQFIMVYNPFLDAIPGNRWVVATQDNFGKWLVTCVPTYLYSSEEVARYGGVGFIDDTDELSWNVIDTIDLPIVQNSSYQKQGLTGYPFIAIPGVYILEAEGSCRLVVNEARYIQLAANAYVAIRLSVPEWPDPDGIWGNLPASYRVITGAWQFARPDINGNVSEYSMIVQWRTTCLYRPSDFGYQGQVNVEVAFDHIPQTQLAPYYQYYGFLYGIFPSDIGHAQSYTRYIRISGDEGNLTADNVMVDLQFTNVGNVGISLKPRTVVKQQQRPTQQIIGKGSTQSKPPNYKPITNQQDKSEKVSTRHLLYHIHPVSGTGVWQQNVRSLLRRIELFNGHRVVAITTGRGEANRGEVLDSVQHVKDAFNGTVHEFIEVENDPDLREVQSFLPLYERVETLNPNHICLWAHAKGVTSEVERPNSVPIWRDLLYEIYLDYWPLVEEQLKEYPITGAFYKTGLPDAWKGYTDSDWHYSGSWWWFRCSELFGQKNWRTIERFKYGIEPYPSLHFSKQQAGCLFFKGEFPTLELYSEKYLKEVVLPAYRVWQSEHIQYRTQSINR